jgi:SAM-dependent methyltransferase
MKTELRKENPFGLNAKGFLWEYFARHGASPLHLDYGAHDGAMLNTLVDTGMVVKGVGVDLNSAAVERGRATLSPGVELFTVKKNDRLPFAEGFFYSVSMVGVLEHIYNQSHIINELKRVTRPGGDILFAVPGRHFFSFLDMGNWKFVFPRAHRFFYSIWKSDAAYISRYSANKDGLIGDIEVEKRWHQHFSGDELAGLLAEHGLFEVERDGYGFFNRILVNIRFFLPGRLKRALDPLIVLDAKIFQSSEIWILVRKPLEPL